MDKSLFTTKEFEQIFSDEISVKVQKVLVKKAQDRVNHLVNMLSKLYHYKLEWWDFDNEDQDSEKNGYFDPNSYVKEIHLTGEWVADRSRPKLVGVESFNDYLSENYQSFDFDYGLSIPSKWLTVDIDDELQEHFNKFFTEMLPDRLLKEKEAEIARDKHLRALRNSIKNKLTPEEYALVSFPKKLL